MQKNAAHIHMDAYLGTCALWEHVELARAACLVEDSPAKSRQSCQQARGPDVNSMGPSLCSARVPFDPLKDFQGVVYGGRLIFRRLHDMLGLIGPEVGLIGLRKARCLGALLLYMI